MEIREFIVKIYDADGVEHSVEVRAESVYEAALKGFERFDRLNLAKDDGCLIVEVYEEPTVHRIQVDKMFGWAEIFWPESCRGKLEAEVTGIGQTLDIMRRNCFSSASIIMVDMAQWQRFKDEKRRNKADSVFLSVSTMGTIPITQFRWRTIRSAI